MPPAGRIRGLLEPFAYGRGWSEIVYGDQPAAGASFALQIQGAADTRLVSATYRLVTSAAVASREVVVGLDDGNGKLYAREGASVLQTASTTQDYAGGSWRGIAEWNTGTLVFHPLPNLFMEGGHVLRLTVLNIDAADQLSNIVLYLERFPSGSRGYPEGVADRPAR